MVQRTAIALVRDAELDSRFDDLQQTIEKNRKEAADAHGDLASRLENVAKALGDPPEAANGPTGLFKMISGLDGRIRPFEALRHKMIGAVFVSGPMLCAFGAIIYFLEGDRLRHLFAR